MLGPMLKAIAIVNQKAIAKATLMATVNLRETQRENRILTPTLMENLLQKSTKCLKIAPTLPRLALVLKPMLNS